MLIAEHASVLLQPLIWTLAFPCIRRDIANSDAFESPPQLRSISRAIQLLEFVLRFAPERGCFIVEALSFLGEFHKAASAICRRRLDRNEAITLEEANHLSHRC